MKNNKIKYNTSLVGTIIFGAMVVTLSIVILKTI